MNKKGFTLIELIAVISILAIILLIVIPKVLQVINDSRATSRKDSIEMYGRAVETAISTYYINNPDASGVTLQELETQGLIDYKGNKVECDETTIWNREVYLGKCKVGNKYTNYTYGDYIPVPSLTDGLVPVVYRNDNWVVVDPTDNDWYDYENQKWANAVVLKQGVTKNVGDTVLVDGSEALMMYVWVPRYEYKIEGTYGKGGLDAEHPGEIEVNFIPKETTTPSSSEYHVHPAFTFGTEEKSGMWVGKFELSSTDNSTSAANLRILPNVSSLINKSVSEFFYAIRGIESENSFNLSNIDTHMMKNSEWGAVAYLSQSRYGKYGNSDYEGTQKEVYINNSSNYITGRSGGNPGGSTPQNGTYPDDTISTTDYIGYGYYTYDGYLLNYNTNTKSTTRDINKGTGASTTGNIYGVYDMSGGSWEYVMGAYGDDDGIYSGYSTTYNSGFTGRTGDDNSQVEGATVPEPKYYDIYKTSTANTACGDNEVCYGHGLSETSGWYGDYADMVTSSDPWFVRGGCYSYGAAGVFHFKHTYGNSHSTDSARVVGFAK